ncbi:putative bifunctional diguanylate cyclase/phosphodiesterase [Devosia sp. XGJD_8]|uniref:putative bifunctional diguanylate cyclase/phosphodiesterase n=1 Tax=Devosia sp. XGJD_8 TaxID=3391187 RepID=UPI003984E909
MEQFEKLVAAEYARSVRLVGGDPGPAAHDTPQWSLPNLLDALPDGVAIARVSDEGAPLAYVNAAFEELTGYAREEAVGKDCRYLQGSERDQPEVAQIRDAMKAAAPVDVTLRNYRRDGSAFWNRLSLRPIDVGGDLLYLAVLRDVSAIREAETALGRAANIDAATGCLNRQSFIVRAEQCSTHPGPVLIVKVDAVGFHDVNTSYGFDVGDALLQETGRRLRGTGAGLVARMGANEFALAFELADEAVGLKVVGNVAAVLDPDFAVPGANISLRFAIGYAIGERNGSSLSLLRNAGTALRAAKSDPLGGPRQFRRADAEEASRRVRMTRELKVAIANDEFVHHFQPQIDLITGDWVGAEALIRWNHPLFGSQPPARFIEAAERTGLLLDLSEQGLARVAAFARRVNKRRERPLRFSFNVSATEFLHRDMAALLDQILRQADAEPSWLTLEITESVLLESSPHVLDALRRLRGLGVGLSVDDFGTGYSSLRLIETFPVTEIKIDRSFVTDLVGSTSKTVIVRSIIDLGRALGLAVVAEGIEDDAQRTLLAGMGCPIGQGYLFARPIDAEDFAAACAGNEATEHGDRTGAIDRPWP